MRKVIYYVASSIDHFIADKDGGIDWLEDEKWEIPGEDYGYSKFITGIDTTLMGYKTYAHIMAMETPFPYTNLQNYVFTSLPDPRPCEQVCFVHYDACRFVRKCKDQAGVKNIWLIGGGHLAGDLLNASLVDEMILTVIPVELGEGRTIFGNQPFPTNARLVETINFDNDVRQEYWKL